mgnify:CR=1 FL=1
MKFAIIAPETQTKKWKVEFEKQAPGEEILIGYETDRPDEIECVLVWGHPKGSLKKFRNLKLIFSMGAWFIKWFGYVGSQSQKIKI